MTDPAIALNARIADCRLCADRFAATATAHVPRPVPWLSSSAPILVSGQAPGMRVHESGRPFDDASGDRLRDWMGIDRDTFYDRRRVAVLPMAFCFPGYDAKGSDLPPPPICMRTWGEDARAALAGRRLTIAIGGYSHRFHLGTRNVTDTVRAWRDHLPDMVPLPHPSWRNTGWLRRNPWFEAELVPWLRTRIGALLADAPA